MAAANTSLKTALLWGIYSCVWINDNSGTRVNTIIMMFV